MLRYGFDLDGGWLKPQEHISSTRLAEELGFDSVWMGDHLFPWFHDQAQAPAVWPWLGAALASTKSIRIGPDVTIPIGGRYHPLLIAQQAATLDNMFPGRFLFAVGTGQAMSEERFLGRWPDWKERGERLREALGLMMKFWESEDYFDWDGKYFPAKKLYLYTRPAGKIDIYVSARGPKAARIAGELGDHIISPRSEPAIVKDIMRTFDHELSKRGKEPSNARHVAYVETCIGNIKELVALLRRGPAAAGLVDAARGEMDPRRIQELGSQAVEAEIVRHHHITQNAADLVPSLQSLIDAGVDYVIFADESRKPNETMRKLVSDVIPHLREPP
jgi:coenzyme F420-dependent glucose-6-phosphate dehydrogenase